MRSVSVLVPIMLLSSLAGCADDATPALAAASTTVAPAAPATVSSDTGGIEGVVTNDELVPLPHVDVSLVQGGQSTKTDAEGRYSFSEVAPGVHAVAFQRLGFESFGKKVTVVAGEIAYVNATLSPVAIVEPYAELLIFKGYIRVGEAFVDIVTSAFGLPGCESCRFNFNATDDTLSMVFEIYFKPTVSNPTGPTKLGYQIWDSGTDKNYATGSWPSGGKRQLDRSTAGWPEAGQAMYWLNYCDALFVCVDQRFDALLTLFHNGEPEDDYTAIPD